MTPPLPLETRSNTASIRRRLTRRLLIQILTVTAISNGAIYLHLRGELIEQYDESLSTEALAVMSLIESEAGDDDDLAELVEESFPRLHQATDTGSYLQIWRADGSVALRSPSMSGKSFDLPSDFRTRARVRTEAITLPTGHPGRVATIKFDEPDHSRTDGWMMMLAESSEELNTTLMHFGAALLFVATATSLFAVTLVVHGVRRELKPLDEFADAVGALRPETLSFRFDENSVAEELEPIALRMNDLLRRLGDAFDRERRFSGNLAHELRTPIAEIRTMLDVATRWPPDSEGTTKLHHDLLAVSVRTSALLDALLAIVRHQQGRQSIALESMTLRPCVDEAWEGHVTAAAARSMRILIAVPADLSVLANHAVMVALLSNLLENAVSYGIANTEVRVHADTKSGRTTLTVENDTLDLHADDLPRLHEPFWRKDAARVDRAHAGLGLALVREYAAAMRVELTMSMPAAGRLIVRLTWGE